MNLLKILDTFSDDKLYTSVGDRRSSFSQFGKVGKGLAFAALPFGLSALSNKANAADISPTPSTPTGALQLALTLEYLEAEFYNQGLDAAGLIPAADQAIFAQIAQHENSHVAFLAGALAADAPRSRLSTLQLVALLILSTIIRRSLHWHKPSKTQEFALTKDRLVTLSAHLIC